LPLLITAATLPELRIEAIDEGSALVIRNTHPSDALTAYLVELVDYPGSSYAFSQDELAQGGEPLAAGKQRRVPVANMTVGAAPDYMKMRAALFADGSTAGDADKVAQLQARRALLLKTVREILARPGDLKSLHDAIPVSNSKLKRSAPEIVDQASRRALFAEALAMPSRDAMLAAFRAREAALSK
jgi:hypothetical protein